MTVDEMLNLENSLLVRYYFYDDELYSTAKRGISRDRFLETKDNFIATLLSKKIGFHEKRYDDLLYKFFMYMPAISWSKSSIDRILCLDSLGLCYVYLNEARCLNNIRELNEIVETWDTTKMDDPEYIKKCNRELADKTRDIMRAKRRELNNCSTLEEFMALVKDDETINMMLKQYIKAGFKIDNAKARTLEKLKQSFNDEITFLCTTIRNVIDICPIEYSEETKNMIDPMKLGLLMAFKSMESAFKSEKEEEKEELDEMFNLKGIYAYWFYKYLKEHKEEYEKSKNKKIIIHKDKEGRDFEYTIEDFIEVFEKFYKENMSNKRMLDKNSDCLGKGFSEFDKMFNERVERDKNKASLEVAASDWEILRAGTIDEEREKIRRRIDDLSMQRRHQRREENLKNLLKQEEEKINNLMKKWEFFDSSNYIVTIKGINEMEGYIGYIYPNGTVLFEQFFDDKKNNEPAFYKAIYVMDILNFINMSSLSKTEIMDYIKHNPDGNVKRIYHTKHWTEKAKKIITEDLLTQGKSEALKEFLKLLSEKDSSVEDTKIKVTKIELENFSNKMKLKESKVGIVTDTQTKEDIKNKEKK